jgi:hypothetical protein
MILNAAQITVVFRATAFRAFSASSIHSLPPGALPQAITFRAFGAESLRFHNVSQPA